MMRFPFPDGAHYDVDAFQLLLVTQAQNAWVIEAMKAELEVLKAELEVLKADLAAAKPELEGLRLLIEGKELMQQFEWNRLQREGKSGNKKRRAAATERHLQVAADYLEFKKAFASYERSGLGPLLTAFDVAKARHATFKLVNVPALLSKRYKLSARHIRTILDLVEVR